MTSAIEGIEPRRDFRFSAQGRQSEEHLAWELHERIASWAADEFHHKLAKQRLENMFAARQVPEDVHNEMLPYFALGIVLESISSKETSMSWFVPLCTWAELRQGSWAELFFGAGMLLSNDDQFPAQSIYSTILRIHGEPLRTEIESLFEHFK